MLDVGRGGGKQGVGVLGWGHGGARGATLAGCVEGVELVEGWHPGAEGGEDAEGVAVAFLVVLDVEALEGGVGGLEEEDAEAGVGGVGEVRSGGG